MSMLGNYYFFCQDFDNALKAYNDLIAKFPASPEIANYKAFLQSIDKEREAIKTLKSQEKDQVAVFGAHLLPACLNLANSRNRFPVANSSTITSRKYFPGLG